jgi:hypothetical protein
MPRLKKHFIVQPYWRSPKGLAPGQAVRYPTEEAARMHATQSLAIYEGAHVLSIEVEEQLDFCDEPKILATVGEVPELMI